ncbi:MAG: hypothetical protein ACRDZU_04335 [Acidimicrobiales bacterium]
MLLHTFAGIAWDPQLRGFLAVMVGVVVLMGSIYLLLVTNIGARLGFMLASAAFFGWLTIMGGVWWVYGTIGMLGEAPHWEVVETAYPGTESAGLEEARGLDTSGLPPAEELNDLTADELSDIRPGLEDDLDGWLILPESNRSFGEAKAAVDEYFGEHPDAALEIEGADDYLATYSFERGGKERLPENPSRIDRLVRKFKTTFIQLKHPPRYAIIQVQPVIEQEAEPGEAPPLPEPDPRKPVVSVIMQRDLGDVRFPGAMLTIFSGIMFGVLCVQLHRRDQRVAQVRALLPATTEP